MHKRHWGLSEFEWFFLGVFTVPHLIIGLCGLASTRITWSDIAQGEAAYWTIMGLWLWQGRRSMRRETYGTALRVLAGHDV